jgi:hypothetical protein
MQKLERYRKCFGVSRAVQSRPLPTKPQRANGELVRSIKGGIWKDGRRGLSVESVRAHGRGTPSQVE